MVLNELDRESFKQLRIDLDIKQKLANGHVTFSASLSPLQPLMASLCPDTGVGKEVQEYAEAPSSALEFPTKSVQISRSGWFELRGVRCLPDDGQQRHQIGLQIEQFTSD